MPSCGAALAISAAVEALHQAAGDEIPAVDQHEKTILKGREITAEGSIIMPIDMRIEATTRSMIRKGRKSRKPISKARRSSLIMKAGTSTRIGTSLGSATGSILAMSAKSLRSWLRTLALMKAWKGTSVFVIASVSLIDPSMSGPMPSR